MVAVGFLSVWNDEFGRNSSLVKSIKRGRKKVKKK